MKLSAPSHTTVAAYAALFFAMSGTAMAATGSTFVTGRANVATTTTTLTDSAGTPLSLSARSGYAPLTVNSSTKVGRLNADLLDGLHSSALQRRITGACSGGHAVTGVDSLGGVACGLDISGLQQRITETCPSGSAVIGFTAAGGVTCTLLSPPPAAPAPAQSSDKGFSIAGLQLAQDGLGDWQAVARITNTTTATRTGVFTVTIFRAGSVIATVQGSVSSLAAANANTVTFVSSTPYSAGDVTTTFQTDSAFNS